MSKKYIIFTYILNKTYIYQVHFLKIIDKKKKKITQPYRRWQNRNLSPLFYNLFDMPILKRVK
jgi:hypothetical protein